MSGRGQGSNARTSCRPARRHASTGFLAGANAVRATLPDLPRPQHGRIDHVWDRPYPTSRPWRQGFCSVWVPEGDHPSYPIALSTTSAVVRDGGCRNRSRRDRAGACEEHASRLPRSVQHRGDAGAHAPPAARRPMCRYSYTPCPASEEIHRRRFHRLSHLEETALRRFLTLLNHTG